MAEMPDQFLDISFHGPNGDVITKETCLDNLEESTDQKRYDQSDRTSYSSQNESQHTGNKKSSGVGFFRKAAAGAVHRIKKAVQDGVSTPFGIPEFFVPKGKAVPFEDISCDFLQADFPTTCKTISKRIATVSKEVFQGLPELTATFVKANKQLKTRQINVNLFAQCNTGKSSLVNALLGSKFLSVSKQAETCLRVLIHHDPKVHPNIKCTKVCSSCPYLEVVYPESKRVERVAGAKNILKRIVDENRIHRDDTCLHSRPDLVLKVNAPFLSKNVPAGWSVVLVDNPGFGEADKHIVEVTSESWESSAAYVYLTTSETRGLITEVNLFKAFKDKGLLKGDQERLIIVLNKIDTMDVEEDSLFDTGSISVDGLRLQIQAAVKRYTNKDFPLSSILGVSAKWGLLSGCLSTLTEKQMDKDYHTWMDAARKMVVNIPSFSCGQGMQESDSHRLTRQELSTKLYEASGLKLLKQKISSMVGSACIKIWGETLMGIFCSLMSHCQAFYVTEGLNLSREMKALEPHMKELGQKLERIEKHKQFINTSFKLGRESALYQELEREYDSDVEESHAVETGISLCHKRVEEFKATCKAEIEKRRSKYSPQQFKQEMEIFLATMEDELQKHFDRECTFQMLHEIAQNHVENARERIGTLNELAESLFVSIATGDLTNEEKLEQGVYERPKMPPKLGDIKTKIGIPNVELNSLLRLLVNIKQLFRRWTIKRHKEDIDESLSEQPEEEVVAARGDTPYKKWTASLENTIEELKEHLKAACQNYFPAIKGRAIQYFYEKVYKRKVGSKFTAFRRIYKERLRQAHKEHRKLISRYDGLQSSQQHCEVMKNHFEKLKLHLNNVHEHFEKELPRPAGRR